MPLDCPAVGGGADEEVERGAAVSDSSGEPRCSGASREWEEEEHRREEGRAERTKREERREETATRRERRERKKETGSKKGEQNT